MSTTIGSVPRAPMPAIGTQFKFSDVEPGPIGPVTDATVVTARLSRGEDLEGEACDAVLLAVFPGELGDDRYAVIYANAVSATEVKSVRTHWRYTFDEAVSDFRG